MASRRENAPPMAAGQGLGYCSDSQSLHREATRDNTTRGTSPDFQLYAADLLTPRAFVKAWIVRLALWGLIPASFATWLIQHGGLKNV